jgi:hypothetical protein
MMHHNRSAELFEQYSYSYSWNCVVDRKPIILCGRNHTSESRGREAEAPCTHLTETNENSRQMLQRGGFSGVCQRCVVT